MAKGKAKDLRYDWRDVVAAMVPLRSACIERDVVLDTRILYRYKPNAPSVLSDVVLSSLLLRDGRQVAAYTSSLRLSQYSVALRPTADWLIASIAYLAIALENEHMPLAE